MSGIRSFIMFVAVLTGLCFSLAVHVLGETSIYVCPATATVCLPPKPHTFQKLVDLGIGVGVAVAAGVALSIFIRRRMGVESEPVGKRIKHRKH